MEHLRAFLRKANVNAFAHRSSAEGIVAPFGFGDDGATASGLTGSPSSAQRGSDQVCDRRQHHKQGIAARLGSSSHTSTTNPWRAEKLASTVGGSGRMLEPSPPATRLSEFDNQYRTRTRAAMGHKTARSVIRFGTDREGRTASGVNHRAEIGRFGLP